MNPRQIIADIFTGTSFIAIISAEQEAVEWWLRCGAYAIAIASGVVAIYFRFWPRHKRPENLD